MEPVRLSEEQISRFTKQQLNQVQQRSLRLNTGTQGDCVVSCGVYTWRLHEEILCRRSDYFRAVFQGGFKEGQSKFLNLEEVVTSSFVCLVLRYIYLSIPEAGYDLQVYELQVRGPRLKSDQEFYGIVLELYRHAAYLEVQELEEALIRDLKNRLQRSARVIFNKHVYGPAAFNKALDDTMTVAIAAYDTSNEYFEAYKPIRFEILEFVRSCHPVLSRPDNDFNNYLRQAPELAIDILDQMSHIESSKFITPGPEVRCQFCNETINEGAPRRNSQPEFGITADCDGRVKYFCSSSTCFRKIRVKDCFAGN